MLDLQTCLTMLEHFVVLIPEMAGYNGFGEGGLGMDQSLTLGHREDVSILSSGVC